MTLKWKHTNKRETSNEQKMSDLTGLLNKYKRTWLLVGYANARVKDLHAKELFKK